MPYWGRRRDPAHTRSELVAILASGWLGGAEPRAVLDLRGANMNGAADQSEINHLKTGVLFVAAVEMAAAILELRDERLTRLQRCASHLGQAFQLMDDLADEAEDDFPRNAMGSVIPLSGR